MSLRPKSAVESPSGPSVGADSLNNSDHLTWENGNQGQNFVHQSAVSKSETFQNKIFLNYKLSAACPTFSNTTSYFKGSFGLFLRGMFFALFCLFQAILFVAIGWSLRFNWNLGGDDLKTSSIRCQGNQKGAYDCLNEVGAFNNGGPPIVGRIGFMPKHGHQSRRLSNAGDEFVFIYNQSRRDGSNMNIQFNEGSGFEPSRTLRKLDMGFEHSNTPSDGNALEEKDLSQLPLDDILKGELSINFRKRRDAFSVFNKWRLRFDASARSLSGILKLSPQIIRVEGDITNSRFGLEKKLAKKQIEVLSEGREVRIKPEVIYDEGTLKQMTPENELVYKPTVSSSLANKAYWDPRISTAERRELLRLSKYDQTASASIVRTIAIALLAKRPMRYNLQVEVVHSERENDFDTISVTQRFENVLYGRKRFDSDSHYLTDLSQRMAASAIIYSEMGGGNTLTITSPGALDQVCSLFRAHDRYQDMVALMLLSSVEWPTFVYINGPIVKPGEYRDMISGMEQFIRDLEFSILDIDYDKDAKPYTYFNDLRRCSIKETVIAALRRLRRGKFKFIELEKTVMEYGKDKKYRNQALKELDDEPLFQAQEYNSAMKIMTPEMLTVYIRAHMARSPDLRAAFNVLGALDVPMNEPRALCYLMWQILDACANAWTSKQIKPDNTTEADHLPVENFLEKSPLEITEDDKVSWDKLYKAYLGWRASERRNYMLYSNISRMFQQNVTTVPFSGTILLVVNDIMYDRAPNQFLENLCDKVAISVRYLVTRAIERTRSYKKDWWYEGIPEQVLPEIKVSGFAGKFPSSKRIEMGVVGIELDAKLMNKLKADLHPGSALFHVEILDKWSKEAEEDENDLPNIMNVNTNVVSVFSAMQMLKTELFWDDRILLDDDFLSSTHIVHMSLIPVPESRPIRTRTIDFDPDIQIILVQQLNQFTTMQKTSGLLHYLRGLVGSSDDRGIVRQFDESRIELMGFAWWIGSRGKRPHILRTRQFGMGICYAKKMKVEQLLSNEKVMAHVKLVGLGDRAPIRVEEYTAIEMLDRLIQRGRGSFEFHVIVGDIPPKSEAKEKRTDRALSGVVPAWMLAVAVGSTVMFFTLLIVLLMYHQRVDVPWWLSCWCSRMSPWEQRNQQKQAEEAEHVESDIDLARDDSSSLGGLGEDTYFGIARPLPPNYASLQIIQGKAPAVIVTSPVDGAVACTEMKTDTQSVIKQEQDTASQTVDDNAQSSSDEHSSPVMSFKVPSQAPDTFKLRVNAAVAGSRGDYNCTDLFVNQQLSDRDTVCKTFSFKTARGFSWNLDEGHSRPKYKSQRSQDVSSVRSTDGDGNSADRTTDTPFFSQKSLRRRGTIRDFGEITSSGSCVMDPITPAPI